MLMIIYIEILQKVQPYSTQEVNDLEFKANIAAVFIIVSVNYVYSLPLFMAVFFSSAATCTGQFRSFSSS